MNLNDAQRAQVTGWIAEGLKVAEIQKRLETELSLRLTYMEVRFLLDDLKVVPKDPPPPPPTQPAAPAKPVTASTLPGATAAGEPAAAELPGQEPGLPGSGGVRVTVDQITKPGAVVSGSVTFSDGQSGMWYLDEAGRLGLGMKQKGYRPAAPDVEEFQIKLQQELARQGF